MRRRVRRRPWEGPRSTPSSSRIDASKISERFYRDPPVSFALESTVELAAERYLQQTIRELRRVLGRPTHLRDPLTEFIGAAFRSDAVRDCLEADGLGDVDGHVGHVLPGRQQRLVR